MEKNIVNHDCDVIHPEILAKVKNMMSTDKDLIALSDFYKILGDKTRISIICALDKHEMCVCDLGALLNMSKSAISHQLRIFLIPLPFGSPQFLRFSHHLVKIVAFVSQNWNEPSAHPRQ